MSKDKTEPTRAEIDAIRKETGETRAAIAARLRLQAEKPAIKAKDEAR